MSRVLFQQDPTPDELEHAQEVRSHFDQMYAALGAKDRVGRPAVVVPADHYQAPPPAPPRQPRAVRFVSAAERACPKDDE